MCYLVFLFHTDIEIFEADNLTTGSWDIQLSDGNRSYDLQISFPSDAWEDTTGTHRYKIPPHKFYVKIT